VAPEASGELSGRRAQGRGASSLVSRPAFANIPAMARDDASAVRLIAAVVIVSIVGAVAGVLVQRELLDDTSSAAFGGLAGAVFGGFCGVTLSARLARRAAEAARTAAVQVPWPLTVDLARRAFRDPEVGLAWKRADVPGVIAALRERGQAVVSGEVWFVKPDGRIAASLTDAQGRICSWTWQMEREPDEAWKSFVARCAEEARENVGAWPELEDFAEAEPGEPHYHFRWKGERGRTEFGHTVSGAGASGG
jgi:hypothetical protein